MKRLMMMLLVMCSMAAAQTCVPGGGVTCTSHIGLWVLPYNYANWNTPTNDNAQLIDTWSATVLPLAGGTMTGNLILNGDPTVALQAATKNYVDTHIAAGSFTLGSTSITLGTTTTSVNGLTLDGVSPTTFGYVDPTSSIQTQLDGKAAKGANSDITSLLGLITPLSPTEGGTGSGAIASALMLGTTSGGVLQAETIGANTVVGNGTGVTAVPTALAMPSCSTSSSALQWTSATGFSCNTGISASTITVGTTAISGGTSGNIEYNNGGVLGEKSTTGSSSVVLATNATISNPTITTFLSLTASMDQNVTSAASYSIASAQTTPATSGANYSLPPITLSGTYWNGTASANDQWNLQPVLGTGTNPSSTLTFTHTGTSGSATVSIPNAALTGTPTAPTPASVISTTQIPTTAYVGTWYAPLASPTFTGTVTAPTLKLSGTNTMTHVPRAYPAWHQAPSTSITTGVTFGPIFWSADGQTIERLTANLTGTTTCSVAPVIAVFTCTTIACASPTNIASLTTGTASGGYDSGALSVTIPSGVFFTAEFTAGTCSSKPAIDFAATVRTN